MEDLNLMELAPEKLEEDLAMATQHMFSSTATATSVLTATGESPVLVETTKHMQSMTTTLNVTHAGKYGNGNPPPDAKEGEQPAGAFGDGEALKGRSVVKKFGRKKYIGEVVGFDSETKWYKGFINVLEMEVVYEDGDEEELEWKEIESILVSFDAAELLKTAKSKKRPLALTDGDVKSPAKKPRGGKLYTEKSTPKAKAKAEKKAKSPKIAKNKIQEDASEKPLIAIVTPKKRGKLSAEEETQATGDGSETQSSEKKKAAAPETPKGQKAGDKNLVRGRPKKEESLKAQLKAKTGKKRKADGKGSADSSSESKPSTRRSSLSQEQDDSKSGRSPRAKAAPAPSPGGSASKGEGVNLIGSITKKKFGSRLYTGEVIGFDPKAKFYKVRYEDGDVEELELKEIKKTLVSEEGQSTPSKTRGQASKTKSTASPSKTESPRKKQKVATAKKGAAKAQSPARDGAQPRKRGRPAKSVSEGSDEDEDSGEDHSGFSRDEGSTAVASNGPGPASALLAAVRFASASNAENLEYFGWGEAVQSNKSRCVELMATKLMPTSSPIVHLAVSVGWICPNVGVGSFTWKESTLVVCSQALWLTTKLHLLPLLLGGVACARYSLLAGDEASQHHLAALTAAGQVLVWRNQHGNIYSRCSEWEHVSDLESKEVVLIDIAGPDIDRTAGGYEAVQEDQVPDPFFLAAVCYSGEDFLLQGSQPQEYVRTHRLKDTPKIKGLRSALCQLNSNAVKGLGKVVQASVGTVEALDETPFVGYITDTNRVYVRSATKSFLDEINHVTGFTGRPTKIQCGGVYHAIILTDDNRAWTWGRGYFPAAMGDSSSSGSADQSPYAVCHPVLGTLVGRKVVDVGCYGEDFIALTSDGDIHQWTHSVPNPAAGVYNIPSTPIAGKGPSIANGDKLKSISIGVGVCAGVTDLGKVHTWRTFLRGALVGMQGPATPLGREGGRETLVTSLGAKVATKVICVAGSLIVVAEKKAKAKPGPKRK